MALMMMLTVAWFAHRNQWGGDIKFTRSRFGRALIELAVVAAAPTLTWALVDKAGLPAQPVVIGAIVLLFAADWKWRVYSEALNRAEATPETLNGLIRDMLAAKTASAVGHNFTPLW